MKPIGLSPQSEEQLKAFDDLYRHSKDGRLRQRAQIVLLAAEQDMVAAQIGSIYREVPLTTEVRTALRNYLAHHSATDHSSAPLWLGTRGALSHRSSIVRLLNKYAYQAGIEDFNPHALRHTFAARYLMANPDDVRGLAALLGHANLNTVMIYTEPTTEDLVERMERVERDN